MTTMCLSTGVDATSGAGAAPDFGFTPMGIEMSEFRKAGGGPKCCTLELRCGDVP